MTVYLDRDAWTSTDASGVTLTGAELVGVAFHWPGTTQRIIGAQTQTATATRLRAYRDFHITSRGWRDIGYTFAFDQAGRVWMLRSTNWAGNLVGAHCASESNPRANHKYVGCLLVLGADEAPSSLMLTAITDWYHTRFLPRWPGRTDIRGHNQVPGAQTSCPGTHTLALINNKTIPQPQEGEDMELSDRLDWPQWMIDNWAPGEETHDMSVNTALTSGYGHSRSAKDGIYDQVVPILRRVEIRQQRIETRQVALDALLVQLVAAQPGSPLSAEQMTEIVEAAIRDNVLRVDVTIDAEPEPDDPA